MFNKSAIFLFVTLLTSMSLPAFADTFSPYIGLTIGSPLTSTNKLSDSSGSLKSDFKPGYLGGLTAGLTFETTPGWNIEQIRTEAEITYRSNELDRMKSAFGQVANMNGTVSVTNYMFNVYLENSSIISNNLKLNLFLTAGVGGASASISKVSYLGSTLIKSANDTQFAYQGGMGAGYNITKNVTIDATYKYMATTKFKFGGVDAEYGSHNILLGARYTFY